MKQQILRNLSWIASQDILFQILGLLFFHALAQIGGAENLGTYSFVLSSMAFVGLALDWGLTTFSWRRWSYDKSMYLQDANDFLMLRLLLSVIIGAVVIGTSWLFHQFLFLPLTIVFVITALEGIRNIPLYFLNATNRFDKSFLIQLFDRGLGYALASAALFSHQNLTVILSMFLISRIASIVVGYCLSPFSFTSRWQPKAMLSALQASSLFFLMSLLTNVYFRIDTIMIAQLRSMVETGIYSAAYRILEAFLLIPQMIALAFFAPLATLKSGEEQSAILNTAMKYLGVVGIAIATFFSFFSEETILFLYGPDYSDAALVARILGWTVPFLFTNSLLNTLLLVHHRERDLVLRSACLVVVNIIANIFLLPRMGITGAALATFLTELLNFVILTSMSKIEWKLLWLPPTIILSMLSFGLLELVPAHVLFRGTAGMAIYLFGLFGLRIVRPADFLSKRSNTLTTV